MKKILVLSLALICIGLVATKATIVASINKSNNNSTNKKSTVYGNVNFSNELLHVKLSSLQENNQTMFLNYSKNNITFIVPLKYKYKTSRFKAPTKPTNK
ncbi:MAG: hypothetical protein QM539_02995 [Alphaproteobacteria bacterium]|nr:hypothetical protein [Alphaproteobacteria bacterium]